MRVLSRCGVPLLMAALTVSATAAGAQEVGDSDESGSDCCLLLLLPVGARSSALGGTIAARSGPETLFRNPAGLAGLDSDFFTIHHSDEGFGQVDAFSTVVNAWDSALGLTYQLFDFGRVTTTDEQGNPTGELSVRNHLLIASFATAITPGLSAGLNYRFYQERIDCQGVCGGLENVGTTHAADMGLRYSPVRRPELQLGLSIVNAGFPLQKVNAAQADAFPARLHLAAAYNVLSPLGADSLLDLWIAVDVREKVREPGSPVISYGVEMDMQSIIFLRAGYTPGSGLGTGAAVGIALRYERFDIALARPFVNSTLEPDSEPFQVSFGIRF